jgi:hypothetical protein
VERGRAVSEPQHIVERGWWTSLSAPETDPAGRTARIAQAETVLSSLAPVFRPLALEVELCWRELDSGLPARTGADAPLHLLVEEGAQDRVTIRPTVAVPPPPRFVPALDAESIAACIVNEPSPGPGLMMDWLEIRSVAAAVRAFEPTPDLTIAELGRAIAPFQPHWFAAPVGDRGYEVWPPGVLTLRAEDRVRFTLVIHWSGWLQEGTPGRAAIESAIARLRSRGWRKDD